MKVFENGAEVILRFWGALALLPLGHPASLAAAVAGRTAPAPPAARWILVYAGGRGRPGYTVADFGHLITSVDTSGQPVGWLMTGALFLEIRASSGRGFATWAVHPSATGVDWEAYIDSLLGPGGAISRLDSAVALATGRIGTPRSEFEVTIMVPYPDPTLDSIRYRGRVYHPSSADDRLALVDAYVHDVQVRFSTRRFRHVTLYGIYWLYETVDGADRQFLPRVAAAVHATGLQFFWIPYYRSAGHESWRTFGFDEAWYQPNYFFHPGLSPLRIDSAMVVADTLGMGIEIELDGRIFTNTAFANNLLPYIVTLWMHPALRARPIAVYDGAGGLFEMATSRDPRIRDQYDRLVSVLIAPPSPSAGH